MMIHLDHVRFAYPGSLLSPPRMVFHNLSLQIGDGECAGVLGPEGSGKSTLLGIVAGVLKPDAGSVIHDGIDLWKRPKSGSGMRGTVGMSMQLPDEQFSMVTVAEEFPPDRREFCDEALRAAGLEPAAYRHRSPFSLSLGESRMLALALLLAQEPDLAVLDVPTAGLDRSGFLRTLRGVDHLRSRGKTLVIASHDITFLRECAGTIFVLQNRKVAIEGDAKRVLSDRSRLAEIGYGDRRSPGTISWESAL